MTRVTKQLISRLEGLPDALQDHFARQFLETLEEAGVQRNLSRKPRTPGLGKGTVQLEDDFDEPLPDAFWLGDA